LENKLLCIGRKTLSNVVNLKTKKPIDNEYVAKQKEELENQAIAIAEQARLINELMGRKDNED
tara:strand:- start:1199 stop:1387 length:189 start_codon:yes stop_codon:yes gene_type:complete